MLSKEEIEFCSSLEKMFNYLKTKKELSEFEQQVIINFDYITRKVLSDECKTATEIVSKNMHYELVKRKEEYYKKQIEQLKTDKQKLIEKLEERTKLIVASLPSMIIEKYKNFKIIDIDDNTYELLALNDLNTINGILKILKGENDE